jgi:invasion protein IalB
MQVAFRTFSSVSSVFYANFGRAYAAQSFCPTWPGSTTNAGPAQLLRRGIIADKKSRRKDSAAFGRPGAKGLNLAHAIARGLTGRVHLLGKHGLSRSAAPPRRCLFSSPKSLDRGMSAAGANMKSLRAATLLVPLRHLVAGFAGALLAAAAIGGSQAQGVVKSKYGDWEIRCETPAGASAEQCALIQSVVAEDKSNVNLVVIVLKTVDGKSRLLRVIAPLGVLLPNGLGLKVDETDIGRAGFVKCLPTGCVAEVVMDDKLIEQLRTGKMATFIIHQVPEEGIGLPLNLQGFKEGYSKLP